MKKSIITTSILLVVSFALVLLTFGIGERVSIISYSNSEDDFERMVSSHRIDMSNPDALRLIPTEPESGYDLAVDLEDFYYSDGSISSRNSIDFYKQDSLLSEDDLNYGMPTANMLPSLVLPKKTDSNAQKISGVVENAILNTSKDRNAPKVSISLSTIAAYRYEPVVINSSIYTESAVKNITMYVRNKKSLVVTPNGDKRYPINIFKTDASGYKGTYLHPFGGDTGLYQAVILVSTANGVYGYTHDFTMKGRSSPPAGKTKKIVSLEYAIDLTKKEVPSVLTGKPTGYEELYDWVRYMKADSFWVLGGQTTGWTGGITPANPWNNDSKKNIDNLAKSTNQKETKLGAYLMAYFAAGGGQKKGGYESSVGYNRETGRLIESKRISFLSEKRVNDIISILKYYDANPNVHYLGLDFIRTGAKDGYEMVDEMVALTGVYTPSNWSSMSKANRMLWLARNRGKREISMKWRWFRAHRGSLIIKAIKDSGIKKPLWAFTLGWAQGAEHGQDPYMFFDAGIDYDAVMIYEANRPQHVGMLQSWPRYLSGEYNVLVGNMVDNRLQDGSLRPEMEYMRRIYESEAKFNSSSRIRGVFFFDMSRMMWSKYRGSQNGIREWANINAAVVSRIEEKYSENPFTVTIELDEKQRRGVVSILNRTPSRINNIKIKPVLSGGLSSVDIEDTITSLQGGAMISVPFKYAYGKNAYSSLLTLRVESKSGDENVAVAYTLLSSFKGIKKRKPAGVASSKSK